MSSIEDIIVEVESIVNQHFSELENKYIKVVRNNYTNQFHLKCYFTDREYIHLYVEKDKNKCECKVVEISRAHGGHQKLIDEIDNYDPNAWIVDIKKVYTKFESSGSNFRNENWNKKDFEIKFIKDFLAS